MRTINLEFETLGAQVILLGVQGESLVTKITADVSGWLEEWPDGVVAVRLIDENGLSHLADTVVEGGTLVWTVTAADTAAKGYGVGVTELVQGDVVKKSIPFTTRVIAEPNASGEAPEVIPGWVEQFISQMQAMESDAEASKNAAVAASNTAQAAASTAIAQTGLIDEVILVQDTVPTAEHNKLYIKRTLPNGIEVATEDELDALRTEVREDLAGFQTDVQGVENKVNGKLDAPQTAGTSGQVLTSDGQGGQTWQTPSGGSSNVQDVQVNGTSILENGVANIPFAGGSRLGVIKTGTGNGIYVDSTNGEAYVSCATDALIKAGANKYRPVVPGNQHQATFYGLAKAAGSDEKNSTLPVGQYTDEAKIAIQKMLGIYEAPWELIREDTFTNETAADHTINVDANGQAFELSDVVLVFTTPKQSTESGKGDYGRIRFYYGSGNSSYIGTYINAYTQTANGEQRTAMSKITQSNGLLEAYSRNNSNRTNTSVSLITSCNVIDVAPSTTSIQAISPPIAFNRIVITAVTGTAKYWLYGRRKWN